MPMTTPKLDDRTYADLLNEARTLIPGLYPEWTDHNPTNPGITLVELFAWLTEMLIFRTDQVPDRHRLAFLRLLNGPDPAKSLIAGADLDATTRDELLRLMYDPAARWEAPASGVVDAGVRATIIGFRRRNRAITAADYEVLAREASADIMRVKCIPQRNLETGTEAERTALRPGHVSVIIVPPSVPFTNLLLFDGTYADHTQEASTEAGPPFALNGAPEQMLYIGRQEPFGGILFRLAVAGQGYRLKFEYFNQAQSDWAPLTGQDHNLIDGTFEWTGSGAVRFLIPADWAPAAVNDMTRYWIRISSSTLPSQSASANQIICALTQTAHSYLEPRRTLTTRQHVVGPIYVPVQAEILVARRADVPQPASPELLRNNPAQVPDTDLRRQIIATLNRFLSPLQGGPADAGWPFGRDVYVSELYELLERIPGVDYVPDIALASTCPPGAAGCVESTPIWHDQGDLIGLRLEQHHLPQAQLDPTGVVVAANFVAVQVAVTVTPTVADLPLVRRAVKAAVRRMLHPLYDGPDGQASRDLTPNAIQTEVLKLKNQRLISDATVELRSDPARVTRNIAGHVVKVHIAAGELVDAQVSVVIAS
jgi:hypothetical protein